jgi:phosphotransferase system enzyme I (PtsI)
MLELQGIPASPGVAIGQALVFDREGYQITRSRIAKSEAASEWQRLQSAMETASTRLQTSAEQTANQLGTKFGSIFSAQQQMLLDRRLHDELRQLVIDKHFSAEYSVSEVLSGYAAAFRKAGPVFLSERADDIRDIERVILEALSGAPMVTLQNVREPAVIVSHDLTPGETAGLDPTMVLGLCMEAGGPGGHSAIVARGMELPAVVGIGPFLPLIRSKDSIIVDGHLGRVIINPDDTTLERYQARRIRRQSIARELTEIRELPACTSDGVRIQLMANIEFPHETQTCVERGADGVGLYRTEFLYLSSETEPSEEEHYQAYSHVARDLVGKPVVMRTLDLGADKMGRKPSAQIENNPFLGLRSIRLSLRNPSLFRTQVRAMLRAAVEGDIRIMFPMITTLDELRSARFLLRSVAEDLREEGHTVRENIPIGMMVEVPAAVLMLDRFVQEVDFVSIGTNDLTQYALAVDRSNEAVADLYQSCDPAVLRLIQRTWEIAESRQIPTSICGEMSNNPALALLLVGMGIRILSVAPSAIPILKKAIRSVSLGQCQAIAWRAMQLGTAREVDAFLQNQLAGLVPEMVLQA